MKIILLSDVLHVGKRNEVKDVNSGHAINFLIPKKLAIAATEGALKKLELANKRAEGEKKVNEQLLVKNLKELDGKTITIKEKANEKGHLFAGLHKEDIANRLGAETRMSIDPAMIELDQPIKTAGNHELTLKVAGKSAKLNLIVEAAAK